MLTHLNWFFSVERSSSSTLISSQMTLQKSFSFRESSFLPYPFGQFPDLTAIGDGWEIDFLLQQTSTASTSLQLPCQSACQYPSPLSHYLPLTQSEHTPTVSAEAHGLRLLMLILISSASHSTANHHSVHWRSSPDEVIKVVNRIGSKGQS